MLIKKNTDQSQRKALRRSENALEPRELEPIPAEPAGDGADVSDLFDVLIRQRRLIVSIVVLSLMASAIGISLVTPRYTATAELLIETPRPAVPALEQVLPGLAVDNQSLISETAVLRSRILLGSVVERLSLGHDPEFNSALRPPGLTERAKSWMGLGSQPKPAATETARIVDALSRRVNVALIPNSRVISVSVTSESPENAAEITNTLVEEYRESQKLAKVTASSETYSFLDERIAELREQLLGSEQRVEKFRSEADLLQTRGTTLISQELADLNAQLIVARAETAAAEARLNQLSELVQSPDGGGIYTASEVLQSPLIQNLRQQQVGVERRIAELSSEYGRAHPIMIQLEADAQDLRSQISIEVNKIAQGLRNEVAVAQARQAALQRQVGDLTRRLGRTNEDEIQLRALEREAEANRQLLETLLASQKELGSPEEAQTHQADARVLSYAVRPTSPSFPQKAFSLGIVFVMSTLLALVVAFVREVRRQGFLDLDQLEAASKLSALGFIPFIASRRKRRSAVDSMVTNPTQPFAQAVKAVNWQLDELGPRSCKVILVTSSIAGEGKTTMAIGLARTKALEGRKTLLIDADIRSPRVHQYLNQPQGPGLREVLETGENVTKNIVFDRLSSLDVLTAGQESGDSFNWINSSRMRDVRSILRRKYDYVIIDSPPIVVAPDACALSKLADTTILLVRWADTPGDVLRHSLRMLRRSGGHLTGTVLTMLDEAKQSKYAYGYYGAYGAAADKSA